MRLNTLKPAKGSKKTKVRVGRGIGCTMGKTSGYGHKGAKARSGYNHKKGFEGGQLPIHRRVPKYGFGSVTDQSEEVRLRDLEKISEQPITFAVIKKVGLVTTTANRAKIILSGKITKAITIKGVKVTKGAKEAIEKAGGKIEE
jgi:large subunit ribosomal protein L15